MSDVVHSDEDRLAEMYANVWDQPSGRVVLQDLMMWGGLVSPTDGPRDEGKRDVALRILGHVIAGGGKVDFGVIQTIETEQP